MYCALKTEKDPFSGAGDGGRAISRILSGIIALLLTLFLLVALPRFLHLHTPTSQQMEEMRQIQVIRLPRPERPPERKEEKKEEPKPPKPVPKKAPISPQVTAKHLPFVTNPLIKGDVSVPDLPPASDTLDGLGMPDIFSAGDLDQPLVPLSQMPPVYPFNAKQRKIEGQVKVRFIVNEQGRVENITILEANPPEIFDQSVKRCVSSWRFKPGTLEGEAVRCWAETTIKFVLK